jgi:hypothetical protein
MSKKDKPVLSSSPIDEPRIGFAKPVGPPPWWYSAFAVVIILFLIIILLSFLRFWLLGNNSSTSSKLISTTPKPTNAPNRQDSYISPLPYDNFNVTITQGGTVTSDDIRTLKVDDMLLIFNQDTIDHTITIQSKQYRLSSNAMYAHKISARGTLKLEIVAVNGSTSSFAFTVQ